MKRSVTRTLAAVLSLVMVLSLICVPGMAARPMMDEAELETAPTEVAASGGPISIGGTVRPTVEEEEAPAALMASKEVYNFTTATYTVDSKKKEHPADTDFFKFTGSDKNMAQDKDAPTKTYDGLTLTKALKMETKTVISFTTSGVGTLVVVTTATNTKLKLDNVADDTTKTDASGIFTREKLPAGSHTLEKSGSMNVYYISWTAATHDPAHNSWGEWEIVTPATCVEDGVRRRTCSVSGCGWTESETIAATDVHDYADAKASWKEVTAPTCTAKGSAKNVCSMCDQDNPAGTTKELDMIPHKWGENETITEPTCTEKGLEAQRCSTCKAINEASRKELPATGHEYEVEAEGYNCLNCGVGYNKTLCETHTYPADWTHKDLPTCAEEGLDVKVCTTCGYTITQSVDKTAHTPGTDRVGTQEATCQHPSYTGNLLCTVCNTVVETGTYADDQRDHNYQTVDGEEVCSMCGQKKSTGSEGISLQGGDLESAYVEWPIQAGVDKYTVAISKRGTDEWEDLDDELIRRYPNNMMRADALGLSAGVYVMRITPYKNDVEFTDGILTTAELQVLPHDRSGFAFSAQSPLKTASGAYNEDGTLKSNAIVVYVTNDNFNSVEVKANGKTFTGVQAVTDSGFSKKDGAPDQPVCIRVLGTIDTTGFPKGSWASSSEGLQIKGSKVNENKNLTIEGVGNDACFSGFGMLIRSAGNVEVRNLAIINFADDGISIDTDNSNLWCHNNDLFYGNAGGDSDQAKGDGSIDTKGSTYVTHSYNHFWDSGKCNLQGMSSESTENYITYHHNWFDHSDSRHPRIRTCSVHIYNNYYDGNSKYGVGMTMGGSAFVENNFFRNCKYPMLTSMQGNDIAGGNNPTFSSEAGGVIKAYGNTIIGAWNLAYYDATDAPVEYDAWLAPARDAKVPANVTAKFGGSKHNNFDTDPTFYTYRVDTAEVARQNVILWAGRVQGGDMKWTFDNATEDTNYAIIPELKTMVTNYKSKLTNFDKNVGGKVDPVVAENQVNTNPASIATTPEPGTDPTGPMIGGAVADPDAKVLTNSNVKGADKSSITTADLAGVADGYFSVFGTDKVKRRAGDASSNTEYIQLDKSGSGGIEFTVSSEAESAKLTIKFSSTGDSQKTSLGVKTGGAYVKIDGKDYTTTTGTSKKAITVVYEGLEPGKTYQIAAAEGVAEYNSRVYSISVTETMPESQEPSGDNGKVDKTALTTALRNAGVMQLTTVTASSGDDVYCNIYWADSTAVSALSTAVTNAQSVAANPEATQSAVNTAVNALKGAIGTFASARKFGLLGAATVAGAGNMGPNDELTWSITAGGKVTFTEETPNSINTNDVIWVILWGENREFLGIKKVNMANLTAEVGTDWDQLKLIWLDNTGNKLQPKCSYEEVQSSQS